MKLFADENVARAIVRWLRGQQHDVLYAAEAKPGAADVDWLGRAEAEERLVITCDKDFRQLVFRDRLNSHGVLLLRLEELTVAERLQRCQAAWAVVEANPKGKFIVITKKKVRVRPFH